MYILYEKYTRKKYDLCNIIKICVIWYASYFLAGPSSHTSIFFCKLIERITEGNNISISRWCVNIFSYHKKRIPRDIYIIILHIYIWYICIPPYLYDGNILLLIVNTSSVVDCIHCISSSKFFNKLLFCNSTTPFAIVCHVTYSWCLFE